MPPLPYNDIRLSDIYAIIRRMIIDLPFEQKPTFPADLWALCRRDKDFMPILVEWHKYIGGTCNTIASISQFSSAIRKMPALNYAILTGLLKRCSRLMLSVLHMSVRKKYGETIVLLDRSIYESAVTVQWLCCKDSDDCFEQYLAGRIKSDLKLKDQIQQNIDERGGDILATERRMLASIQELMNSTELSEEQIRQIKPLPDLWNMYHDAGLSEGFYIGTQRMGSHEVHGTWTARGHYLRQGSDGEYSLRDHDVRPHENQFMVIPLCILDTLMKFIEYVVSEPVHREPIESILTDTKTEILTLTQETVSPDFEFDSGKGFV